MYNDRFPKEIRGLALDAAERQRLDGCITELRKLPPRTQIARAGAPLHHCTLLLDGIVSRHIDDRQGLRQLVAVHFPKEFVDLDSYLLRTLDHDVTTMTASTVAIIPHAALDEIIETMPQLARKLWCATLVDAAIHRAWLFRLGRLDAVGRIAHFLCEANARLAAAGLSDGCRFALDMTQTDLAEICGLTNIHVNRVMRQLREERLCVFRSAVVEILDSPKFAARGQFKPDYLYLSRPRHHQPARAASEYTTHLRRAPDSSSQQGQPA